jgi:hypothetical protein
MADSTGATTGRSRTVRGLFRDRESAERAYGSLSTRGYSNDDIDLLMTDETRSKYFAGDKDNAGRKDGTGDLGDKAWEDAGKGAAIGSGVGATIAAIAAIGTTLAIPGLNLLVAGPIAAALAGAGAGGLTGGLIGALVGHGVDKEHAEHYDRGVREGGIVMGVNARSDEDADYFENEFRTHRGEHVYR